MCVCLKTLFLVENSSDCKLKAGFWYQNWSSLHFDYICYLVRKIEKNYENQLLKIMVMIYKKLDCFCSESFFMVYTYLSLNLNLTHHSDITMTYSIMRYLDHSRAVTYSTNFFYILKFSSKYFA